MPTITMYATGAGRFQDVANNNQYLRSDTALSTDPVASGGFGSSMKESVGYWTWLGAPGLATLEGAAISQAVVVLQCSTVPGTDAAHIHSVATLSEDPKGVPEGQLPSPGMVLGSITTNGVTSIPITEIVRAWAVNPATAYGVATDLVEPRDLGAAAHSFEGFGTARISATYSHYDPPILLIPADQSSVSPGQVMFDWDDPNNVQEFFALRRKRIWGES